ncbi:carnitine acetyl transferase protein [Pyrenophora tritici-repentis]|nr:carnitine acetyl transferase protein [Pyrenophora tritici-repentis]
MWELESGKLVLLDQVCQTCLGKPQGCTQFRQHVPFEFVRRCLHISKAFWVAFRWVWARRGPETGCAAVDGPGKAKNGVSVHIGSKPKYCMAVDTGVFKIDARASVLAHNDLKLVIPTVRACTDLNTALNLASSAEHVHAEISASLWLGVVQT